MHATILMQYKSLSLSCILSYISTMAVTVSKRKMLLPRRVYLRPWDQPDSTHCPPQPVTQTHPTHRHHHPSYPKPWG